jgi:hypothetical protein
MAHCEGLNQAPIAIHCPLGLTFHSLENANTIADCLEKQFTPRDLSDDGHERQVEIRVQALLEAVDNEPPEKNKTT